MAQPKKRVRIPPCLERVPHACWTDQVCVCKQSECCKDTNYICMYGSSSSRIGEKMEHQQCAMPRAAKVVHLVIETSTCNCMQCTCSCLMVVVAYDNMCSIKQNKKQWERRTTIYETYAKEWSSTA